MASPVALLSFPSSTRWDPPVAAPGEHEQPDYPVGKDGWAMEILGANKDDDPFVREVLGANEDDDPFVREILGANEDEDPFVRVILGADEDDDPIDLETTCPGQNYTPKQVEDIRRKWVDAYANLSGRRADLINEILSNEDGDDVSIPPAPLKVLPVTTHTCIERGYCYHREYMTYDTSETRRTLGFHQPQEMLQIFSLRLSLSCQCPLSVYGIFAVRDDLEPLRNYVFNRPQDDPVMIKHGSFTLPLCSPCRGMYVLERALLEVDLWVKKGDSSNDEQLLSAYVEIDSRSIFDVKRMGRIHGDHGMLDMNYMYLELGVEAVIHVKALVDNPYHVRFTAFSSCFDDEIMLFEGEHLKKDKLIQHVVAVKAKEKLGVRLELDNSIFEWVFQDGAVGVSSRPDDSILNQFHVRVFFSPKNVEGRPFRYDEWKERCKQVETSSVGLLK